MKILFAILILATLFSFGCTNVDSEINETENETYLGELLEFKLADYNIPIDGAIVIESASILKEENISNETVYVAESEIFSEQIYMFEYCGIPLGLLKQTDSYYTWIYPYTDDCSSPTNTTFTPNMTIQLQDIPLRDGNRVDEGSYRIKLVYSTYASGEYMRETNILINITQ